MNLKQKNAKGKSKHFSDAVHSAITGYALGITFILISLFLFYRPDYLKNEIVTRVVGVAIGLFGIFGFGSEVEKTTNIFGFSDVVLGTFFVLGWHFCYDTWNTVIANTMGLLLGIFGIYAIVSGVISIGYSILSAKNKKDDGESTPVSGKSIFLLITQFFSLILTILNILKIIGLIGTSTGG